ncbi:MAG: Na/Pi cotransporter family protein [Oscillospiraceae bacterium]|nr:Na/Pi cotransporter family protein [Oscillospiraceae bacterium]
MAEATWEFLTQIFLICGGLGLFLFGMKIMSDGLDNLAADRMRTILERATANRFLGVLVGALVTAVIQSSSATTVILVGFVNAGLMGLAQAISVSMGAAIGTTITAQIAALKIDPYAPLLIFIGLLIFLTFKKRTAKNAGYVLLGFGILFFGMTTMGSPLKDFATHEGFQSMLSTFDNPVLAIFVGLVFTCIVQSSSASTVIFLILIGQGVITFDTAVFLTMGSNIGTCITASIASLAANREAKRLALSYVLFKIFGTLTLGSVVIIFRGAILPVFENIWPGNPKTQLAMYHTFFNTTITFMFVGFIKQIEWLSRKIIPERQHETANAKSLLYLNQSVLNTPAILVPLARREVCRMGQIAIGNLKLAVDSFLGRDQEKAGTVIKVEETVNFLHSQITGWLVRIRTQKVSPADMEKAGMMLRIVADFERIGGHAENIAEYTQLYEKGVKISEEAIGELKEMSDEAINTIEIALDIFEKDDKGRLPELNESEDRVDALADFCIESHIQRLKDEKCDPRGGVVFTDMVIDLERCADHGINISETMFMEKQ